MHVCAPTWRRALDRHDWLKTFTNKKITTFLTLTTEDCCWAQYDARARNYVEHITQTHRGFCFSRYASISLYFSVEPDLVHLRSLKAQYTHQMCFCWKKKNQTADWAGGFTHTMRMSHGEKATLFTDEINFFSNSRTANKGTVQWQWLWGTGVRLSVDNHRQQRPSGSSPLSPSAKHCLANEMQFTVITAANLKTTHGKAPPICRASEAAAALSSQMNC